MDPTQELKRRTREEETTYPTTLLETIELLRIGGQMANPVYNPGVPDLLEAAAEDFLNGLKVFDPCDWEHCPTWKRAKAALADFDELSDLCGAWLREYDEWEAETA